MGTAAGVGVRDDDGVLPLHGAPPSKDVRDLTEAPCCCICGRALRGRDYLCIQCKGERGLDKPQRLWPEWVKFLAAEESRRRYRLYRSLEAAIDFVPFEDEEEGSRDE